MTQVMPKLKVNFPRPHTTPEVTVTLAEDPILTDRGCLSSKMSQRINKDAKLEPVQEEMAIYEWPDLPPIGQIKNAIARQRVSQGVSYILPVHKTKSSVENVYRTNLRVMFQEPYLNEDPRAYDDVKIKRILKHHFVPNTSSSAVVPKRRDLLADMKLNAESEKVRKLYSQSAPSTGLTGRHSEQMDDLRQRSSLYLPIKATIPPEAARLKAEADKIIKSVQDEQEKRFESAATPKVTITSPVRGHSRRGGERTDHYNNLLPHEGSMRRISNFRKARLRSMDSSVAFAITPEAKALSQEAGIFRKASMFSSYDALKSLQLDESREFPEDLLSPYVSYEKASAIWQWLHSGEVLNEFTHFLQVCS